MAWFESGSGMLSVAWELSGVLPRVIQLHNERLAIHNLAIMHICLIYRKLSKNLQKINIIIQQRIDVEQNSKKKKILKVYGR